jgi:hypothetical protein
MANQMNITDDQSQARDVMAYNDDLTYHEWLVKEIADMERRLDNHVVSPGMRTIYEIYLDSLRRDLRQSEENE